MRSLVGSNGSTGSSSNRREPPPRPDPEARSATNYLSFSDNNNNASSNIRADGGGGGNSGNADPLYGSTCNTSVQNAVPPTDFRGFSTSISDMYKDVEQERIDCCALTCFGMLQSDRDRYLLQGVTPPGAAKRCLVHVVLPFCIFIIAGVAATHIQDKIANQMVCYMLVFALVLYFVMQCYKGRLKRIAVRKDLLWLKYQIEYNKQQRRGRSRRHRDGDDDKLAEFLNQDRPHDEEDDDPDGWCCSNSCCTFLTAGCTRPAEPPHYMGQTRGDLACSHPCCCFGFYAVDDAGREDDEATDDEKNNLCRALFRSCCGIPCCCFGRRRTIQVCGACAIAQEARELERLLPAPYRRIDYVSMQPMSQYYDAIYRARWEERRFPPPLSRLSYRLLQAFGIATLIFFGWSMISKLVWKAVLRQKSSPGHLFGPLDFVIYCLTWLDACGLLTLIVYFVNGYKQAELSLDAIIKYFASGFFLSTFLAVFWELLVSVGIGLVVRLILLMSGNHAVEQDGYSNAKAHGGAAFFAVLASDSGHPSSGQGFLQAFGNDHPVFATFYIFINAFCVAALIEELSKYFSYRMVEHPDFMSRQELREASRIRSLGEDDDDEDEDDQQPIGVPDYSHQRTSLQAQGTAITLAMVAVAMGFTCCENLVYIFRYTGGGGAKSELEVLLSRSIFPVHPIAAALQSLGVCKRDIEERHGGVTTGKRTKLWDILFPAVLFHGAYDFFILWLDYLAQRNGVYAREEDAYNALGDGQEESVVIVLISFSISMLCMALALVYLHRESRAQRQRLAELDAASNETAACSWPRRSARLSGADASSSLI